MLFLVIEMAIRHWTLPCRNLIFNPHTKRYKCYIFPEETSYQIPSVYDTVDFVSSAFGKYRIMEVGSTVRFARSALYLSLKEVR